MESQNGDEPFSYLMPVMAIRNGAGDIVMMFPPRFLPDHTIRSVPYRIAKNFAEAAGMELILAEVKVVYIRTGRTTTIPNGTRDNTRAIGIPGEMQGVQSVYDLP